MKKKENCILKNDFFSIDYNNSNRTYCEYISSVQLSNIFVVIFNLAQFLIGLRNEFNWELWKFN